MVNFANAKKRIRSKRLGELLIDWGIINEKQLDDALNLQDNRVESSFLGELLIELGLAKEEDIAQAFIHQYQFPFVPIKNYHIELDITKIIPYNLLKKFKVVPIDKIGDCITLAMANPLATEVIKEIELFTKCKVQPLVATNSDIIFVIEEHFKN